MDKCLWEHVQIFLDRGDLLRLKEKLPSSTQRASDLVATGPHSAPTKLGPGRVLIMSCAAFDTNTTLAVGAYIGRRVGTKNGLRTKLCTFLLIPEQDSSGKPFVESH